jgi:hypothetical protein
MAGMTVREYPTGEDVIFDSGLTSAFGVFTSKKPEGFCRRPTVFEELRSSHLSSLMTFEILLLRVIRPSAFSSSRSKNLSGSSPLSGLMTFKKREFSNSLCFILNG